MGITDADITLMNRSRPVNTRRERLVPAQARSNWTKREANRRSIERRQREDNETLRGSNEEHRIPRIFGFGPQYAASSV